MSFVWVLCRSDDACSPPLQAFGSAADALTALRLMKMTYCSPLVFKVSVWPAVSGNVTPTAETEESLAAEDMSFVPGGNPLGVAVLRGPATEWRKPSASDPCDHVWLRGQPNCTKCGEPIAGVVAPAARRPDPFACPQGGTHEWVDDACEKCGERI